RARRRCRDATTRGRHDHPERHAPPLAQSWAGPSRSGGGPGRGESHAGIGGPSGHERAQDGLSAVLHDGRGSKPGVGQGQSPISARAPARGLTGGMRPQVWRRAGQASGAGQLLVQVLYLSVDPALRGWLNPARTYIAPVEIGDVMRAIGVGKVVEANGHNRFSPGDYVMGMLGAQEVCTTDGEDLVRVDPALAPLPTYLGTLGRA